MHLSLQRAASSWTKHRATTSVNIMDFTANGANFVGANNTQRISEEGMEAALAFVADGGQMDCEPFWESQPIVYTQPHVQHPSNLPTPLFNGTAAPPNVPHNLASRDTTFLQQQNNYVHQDNSTPQGNYTSRDNYPSQDHYTPQANYNPQDNFAPQYNHDSPASYNAQTNYAPQNNVYPNDSQHQSASGQAYPQTADSGQHGGLQQSNTQPTTTAPSQSLWDSSISGFAQASAWLHAHNLRRPEMVRPQYDDVSTEIAYLDHHANNLLDALSRALPPAKSDWTSLEVEYYEDYQASGLIDLENILSTQEGRKEAQCHCIFTIQHAFDLHTMGIPSGITDIKADPTLKVSERIASMIDAAQIKRVAIDIAVGNVKARDSLVKDPIKLLRSRLYATKNNANKRDRNVAGAAVRGTTTKASKARSSQTPTASRKDVASNFGTSSSSTASSMAPISMQGSQGSASGLNGHASALKRRLETVNDLSASSTFYPAAKRRRTPQTPAFDSGYVTPSDPFGQAGKNTLPSFGMPMGPSTTGGLHHEIPSYSYGNGMPTSASTGLADENGVNRFTGQKVTKQPNLGHPGFDQHGTTPNGTSPGSSWDAGGGLSQPWLDETSVYGQQLHSNSNWSALSPYQQATQPSQGPNESLAETDEDQQQSNAYNDSYHS